MPLGCLSFLNVPTVAHRSSTVAAAMEIKSAPPHEPEEPEAFAYAIQVDAPPSAPPGEHHHQNDEIDPDEWAAQPIKVGAWDAGFCGCEHHCVPNCCMTWFCPCVSLAQISARLGIAPYECSLVTLALVMILTVGMGHIFIFIWIWQVRYITRDRFHIPGDCCGDCCAALCCPCCTLAQVATHIKSYKPNSCDFGPPDVLPGYRHE